MNVTIERAGAAGYRTPLLALPLFEGEAAPADLVPNAPADFRGKAGESLVVYPGTGAERVLLVGLGKRGDLKAEMLRRAAGTAAKQAQRLKLSDFAIALGAELLGSGKVAPAGAACAVAEGAVLGGYRFTEMKTQPAEGEQPPVQLERAVVLVAPDAPDAPDAPGGGTLDEAVRTGAIVARAENLARTLGNLPGNRATPTYLAETAQRIAGERGMTCTVLGRKELEAEGMKALLAVAQGTAQEPKLIVVEHRGGAEGEKPLVLVGKGLTFDAGGISIKPAAGMEDMKFDMSGGGAVIGAMQAIAELGIKANVIGVVPSSENLLGAAAMKPGDVIGSHLGKTIEVVNTDAEGRLILVDALSYVRRFEPAAVVDAATLTGACVIALGHQASAVMGNDDALV
ncbi:MAG TPA: leucyl aminopeptidase, partial [Longimicrobiaceae bacterium]|nr:leucyl aminopeptidase [Longimicrobiaceae bacterium]